MTNRFSAAIAAGILAVGLLTGAAGAVLLSSSTSPNTGGYGAQMADMHDAMRGFMNGRLGPGVMGSGWTSGMMGGQHGSGMMGGQR